MGLFVKESWVFDLVDFVDMICSLMCFVVGLRCVKVDVCGVLVWDYRVDFVVWDCYVDLVWVYCGVVYNLRDFWVRDVLGVVMGFCGGGVGVV